MILSTSLQPVSQWASVANPWVVCLHLSVLLSPLYPYRTRWWWVYVAPGCCWWLGIGSRLSSPPWVASALVPLLNSGHTEFYCTRAIFKKAIKPGLFRGEGAEEEGYTDTHHNHFCLSFSLKNLHCYWTAIWLYQCFLYCVLYSRFCLCFQKLNLW